MNTWTKAPAKPSKPGENLDDKAILFVGLVGRRRGWTVRLPPDRSHKMPYICRYICRYIKKLPILFLYNSSWKHWACQIIQVGMKVIFWTCLILIQSSCETIKTRRKLWWQGNIVCGAPWPGKGMNCEAASPKKEMLNAIKFWYMGKTANTFSVQLHSQDGFMGNQKIYKKTTNPKSFGSLSPSVIVTAVTVH